MMALVEAVVEEQHVLQDELEQITTEVWLADDVPSGHCCKHLWNLRNTYDSRVFEF